jgi:membrane-associated phospholipid phosphatase
LVSLLKLTGKAAVVCVAIIFVSACVLVGVSRGAIDCVRLVLSALIPFALVSAMRIILDFKRPYEMMDFPPFEAMRAERKSGRSFPSRHVFSAFAIGVLMLPVNVYLGLTVIIIGTFFAVERVLLGIHFPRDVIAGAIIGILSGVLGILFL